MDNLRLIRAENAFHEGNFLLASSIYDTLLAAEPENLELLLGKTNCLIFLRQWNDCVRNLLRSAQNKRWKPSCLDDLVCNLFKVFTTKKETPRDECIAEVIQPNLLCAICLQLLYNPTTLICGHSFCRQCVIKQEKRKCFYCTDVHFDSNELSVNFVVANIVTSHFEQKMKAVELRYKGNDFWSQHNYEEAFKKYREALELDPNSHLTLSNLSHVASTLGDYQAGLDYAEKACILIPHWEKALHRKACALVGLKNYSQAAIAYLQIYLLNPKNEIVSKSLTKVLLEMLSCESLERNEGVAMFDDLTSSLNLLEHWQPSTTKEPDFLKGSIPEIGYVLSEKLTMNDLECSLCCKMFYRPITGPCGHTFCQWCLNRCLDHKPSCPVCRYPMDKYIGVDNQHVTTMIELLCEKYFPQEFNERKTRHEEEISQLASVAMDTSENIPIFVCTLAIPTISCDLHVFEPRYRLMVRECMESGSRQFGMCLPSQDDNIFADYGVMLEIQSLSLLSDGRSLLKSVGSRRFKVLSRGMKNGYHTAVVEWLFDESISEDNLALVTERQLEVYEMVKGWFSSLSWFVKLRLIQMAGEIPECDHANMNGRNGPNWIWWCVNLLPMENNMKLEMIAMTDIKQRLDRIQDFIGRNANG